MKPFLPGRYVTTRLVNNPKPDRRSSRLAMQPYWEQGTRVRIDDEGFGSSLNKPLSAGRIVFRDHSYVFFSLEPAKQTPSFKGNALIEFLEPEPERLGYVLDDHLTVRDAARILGVLLDQAKISYRDVNEACLTSLAMSEEEFLAFRQRHHI